MKPYAKIHNFSYHNNVKISETFSGMIQTYVKFGIEVKTHHKLLANLTGIIEAFATGDDWATICKDYDLKVKPKSLSWLFKYATGTSISVAVRQMEQAKNLHLAGYSENEIDNILEITNAY